ncbi:MAG: GH92 family glycosyl hydrolase, partial [Microcoleaceae cyanobacterium]
KLLIDLVHRRDEKTLAAHLTALNPYTLIGSRISQGWSPEQRIYFYITFDRPFKKIYISTNGKNLSPLNSAYSKHIQSYLDFGQISHLKIRVGISAVDLTGAHRNLETEIPSWQFHQTVDSGKQLWRDKLAKIDIQTENETDKTIFYTALYHTYKAPHIYMDIDKRFRGADGRVHTAAGFTNYTLFSLWDTFRALHPLMTLLEPAETSEYIKSMLIHYDQVGELPKWKLGEKDVKTMIGQHAISVIADAFSKGLKNYDNWWALGATIDTMNRDETELNIYRGYGFVPSDVDINWSVSQTLEFAYNDWAIAQIAKSLGNISLAENYQNRSQQAYRQVFDPSQKLMRPKLRDGTWDNFDPFAVGWYSPFIEGNSWQYTWFVPQDIPDLIQLMGGKSAFLAQLQKLFSLDSNIGNEFPDITGLIGQYAHGNEPSHHIPYLFNFVERNDLTRAYVKQILTTMYKATADGLIGNEDCGQMSAWYILSALGLYQVTPGTPMFDLGYLHFSQATIHLDNGNDFTIKQGSHSEPYLLNAQPVSDWQISYQDIMNGGVLSISPPTTTNIMQWYNLPPVWNEQDGIIQVTTGAKTDFWRVTHYDFIRDNGHFYYQNITGDFTAQVKITGKYQTLYDQAGLMVRLDEKTWLKCGIEFVNGVQQASAVVTREYSDWSVMPLRENPESIWLRLKRSGETVEVEYSLDGESYSLLRLAYLTTANQLQVGLMCASPDGEGFSVTFEEFRLFDYKNED